MLVWRNWHTRVPKEHVSYEVQVQLLLRAPMAKKKRSGGSSKYASENRFVKNKIRKLEAYVLKHPNDTQKVAVLEQYKAKL